MKKKHIHKQMKGWLICECGKFMGMNYKEKYERADKKAKKYKDLFETAWTMKNDLQINLENLVTFSNELSTEKLDMAIKKMRLESKLNVETKSKRYWRLVAFLSVILTLLVLFIY